MNTSSVVSRLAEVPWAYSMGGRLTALLILAWVAHAAFSGRNPRWRVLLWRSAVVGLAMIVLLKAAPPVVTWQLPYAESIVVPVADSVPTLLESPGPIAGRQALNAAELEGRSESEQRSIGVPPRQTGMTAPSPRNLLLAIWLLGVGVMTVRLGLCVWRVSRIVRQSTEVPTWVVEECGAVASALGFRRAVLVVQSADIPAPCLTGLFRPRLLLPGGNWEETNRTDLRAILAHELAHAGRHDLVWNVVLHFLSILLWFHPLAWRMRAAHLAACDAVCDALAADLVGDVALYGRTLARLALRVAGPTNVPGLAMARTPDVLRRIEALERRVFRGSLPRRLIVPALLALGGAVIVIGGLGITIADQPPARKATEAELDVANADRGKNAPEPSATHRLSLRVLGAKTGEPLEGVSVRYEIRGDGKPLEQTVMTGKEGTVAIDWPAGINIRFVGLNVKKAGYVGAFLYWDDRNHAIALPESREARLELGVPISGVVRDEAGKPIAGANVIAMCTAKGGERPHMGYELGTAKTDEQGRWRIDDAPANVSDVSLHVSHPDYQRRPGQSGGGREWRTILSKAATVRGRVVDGSGKPVKGARVGTGGREYRDERTPVATDELGQYNLRGCEPGSAIVTAQAEGFGPEFREVNVPKGGEAAAPDIRLGKPSTLRVRVVDRAGRPIAGVYLQIGTWRGHESLLRVGAQTEVAWRSTWNAQTDADGRFVWRRAPGDAMQFHIFRDGYLRKEPVSLTASDEEHVVTMDPELVISGSVTDAVTGKPVPHFRVIQGLELEGKKGITWWRMMAVEYTGGRYSMKFDMPRPASYVLIEAAGYEPAESRGFRPDEGAMIQDFRLKPAAGISGVVLRPDGRPAAGVQVGLGTRDNRAAVRGGVFEENSNAEKVTTGPDGRFTLPKHEGAFLLVVAADTGFGDVTSDEFAKTGKLVLRPWGRIEGEMRIGREPAAYQPVVYLPKSPSNRGDDAFFMRGYDYHFTTDSQGRFAIDRVIPGGGEIARVVVTTYRREWCERMPVEVKPGETTQVRLGGKGRPVIGRVVVDGTPREPVDWRSNDAAVLEVPRAERGDGKAPWWIKFASGFDADGKFRIEDVAPGTYELKIPVNLPSDKRTWGTPRATMGEATVRVTVPEGADDQAVDVGDVKVGVK